MKVKQTKAIRTKQPWPTKAAMEQVYALKLWGENDSDFYSGDGSHRHDIVEPYINTLTSFLTSFESPLVVCDLGCGDFNVGKQLVQFTEKYVAVDIVSDLIERNKQKFTDDKLEFHCLDIAADDIPSGDCAIVRQVLQHLSNAEITNTLNKLSHFKYVILTEHLPEGHFTPNIDIISGQGIRIKKQSGLDVLAPPFNFKVKEDSKLVSYDLGEEKGVIVTALYTLF